MSRRHFTPLPVPTLEACWHRVDVLAEDVSKLEDEARVAEEKVANLLAESIRVDEKVQGIKEDLARIDMKIADHSQAVRAFRYRDAQLVVLGVLGVVLLGWVLSLLGVVKFK